MTKDVDKIGRGFARAFQEAGDVSVDADIDSQRRQRRRRELDNWSVEIGRRIAADEGIELNEARLEVIHTLRDHYRVYGLAEHGRQLGDMLDKQFARQGGRKYLRRLFPGGPVAQGMRIAGLPVPAHTEDEGFGTAR